LENKRTVHKVYVQPEKDYSFADYAEIIRLECERMDRLICTHDYISEGNEFLVPENQEPQYFLPENYEGGESNGTIYQRFGANSAFYGVPKSPDAPPPTAFRPKPYELVSKLDRIEDPIILELLESTGKIICISEAFWANYHYLLHTHANLSQVMYYGWEDEIKETPVSLATTCYRYTPFTFQSWLLYRAPCEDEPPLIIAEEWQVKWIRENALHLIPDESRFLILSENHAAPENCTKLDVTTFNGLSLFQSDVARLKNNADAELETSLKNAPKISVIICSYNQGEFLEKCIKSILDQKYSNLELIVVDGNSTDESIAILERYRPMFAHLLIEDDNGQSDALNKGFSLSTGDVMTWICSDDGLEPGSLLKVAKAFAHNESLDIVVGGCRRVDPQGKNLSVHHTFLPYEKQVRLSFGDMISFGHTWLRSFYFIQPELFWSRRIWERSGGYIKNHMFFAMDYELFLRFALAGAQAFHIADCLAFALVHDAQKSAHQGRNLPTIMRMMDEFKEMLSSLKKG